jgi:hypothetical protein
MAAIADLTGYDFSIVHIITAIATVALRAGHTVRAARLLGAGDMLRKRLGYPLAPVLVTVDVAACLAETRAALGDSEFKAAYDAGAALTPDEAVEEALNDFSL